MNRWDCNDSTDEGILVFIRRDLDELKSSAGILHLPGSHKDRKIDYGDFSIPAQLDQRQRSYQQYYCELSSIEAMRVTV